MTDTENLQKVRARDIGPELAIEVGYNLYLLDACSEGSALRKSAETAVQQFNRIAEAFLGGTQEGLYIQKLRMAANSLARGIARRKQILKKREGAAEQKKTDMVVKIAQTEKLAGILRGGFQLLLLGGFGYALVKAFFAIPALAASVEGLEEQFASLASALGVALIGSFFKSWFMTRRILKVFKSYENAITGANEEYAQSVLKEYKFAAEEANLAFKQLTGEDPPVTEGFQNLLIGIIGGENEREGDHVRQPIQERKGVIAVIIRQLERIQDRLLEG